MNEASPFGGPGVPNGKSSHISECMLPPLYLELPYDAESGQCCSQQPACQWEWDCSRQLSRASGAPAEGDGLLRIRITIVMKVIAMIIDSRIDSSNISLNISSIIIVMHTCPSSFWFTY